MKGYFDKAAGTWDACERRQGIAKAVAEAIISTIPLHREMDILDFGAGTGLLTIALSSYVRSITALDSSQGMLGELEAKARSVPDCIIEIVQGDIMEHVFNKRFHGAVSSMTLHHIRDTAALFKKLASLLRPHGFVALADLADDDGTFHDEGRDDVFHFGFPKERLVSLATSAGFSSCDYRLIHTVEKEGRNRPYNIFLFTARYEGYPSS